MKIALIRRRFSPTGGAERYLVRLAAGLMEAGHELTLYCETWSAEESPFTRVEMVPSNDPHGFSNAIQELRLRDKHDVVFSLERVPGAHIYRAGDGLHVEWLAHRNAISPILGPIRTFLRPKNGEMCRLEAQVFDPKLTDRIICNSAFIAKQVVKRFAFPAERLDIVPNGVPVDVFGRGDREIGRKALGLGREEYVVLLVGAGKERKGHSFAKKAVTMAKRAPKLVIIDQPPSVPMPHIYAAADVFYLPTLYDPFANVTLEALAAGLPVITTAQNGASEIITQGENGFILRRADEVREAAKLIDQLADLGLRESIRNPAKALAAKYDLSRNLRETMAVIERITAKN